MRLYHLKHVPWMESQLVYHAQPRVGVEGLNILEPSEPYVCVGYHQDVEQEIDQSFCQEHNIPLFRRQVGGGAVYLDGNQIFYQIVLHQDHPLAQGGKTAFYQRMLQPVAEAYGDLGVSARYRPVNDIVTDDGRKISGTGAATIGDYVVLVGNLIADFDYETTSRVLCVPDEKYRDKVFALFSTLKPRDEVEGSGMGLAFVQKVVKRQGGKVRIESRRGRGTNMFFSWPKDTDETNAE